MSAETPGTGRDTEVLAIILDKCSLSGQECHNPLPRYSELTDDRNTHWHRRAAEDGEPMVQLAAYVARKVEAVERERDEWRAGCDAWIRNTVSADGRYYALRDAVLGADACPAHEFVPVAGHPDDDECTHRWDETDATYCGRPCADHEHDWDAEAVERAKQARAAIERVTALAASLRRPLGGSGPFGAGSPEQRGCDYAADRLDATIAEPTEPASDRPLTVDEHLAEIDVAYLAAVERILTAREAAVERRGAVNALLGAADEWEQEDTDAVGDWLRDRANRVEAGDA